MEVNRALLFPGQGSQRVGMARELARAEPLAAKTLAEADEALGFSLGELMAEGPRELLTETRHAQPAILTHSVAVLRTLGEKIGNPAVAAGHSLGEFSAYVAAGAMNFQEALLAVRRRGELMFSAGAERPGAMAAVIGLRDETVSRVLLDVSSGECVPANFNSPGQVVVSGDARAVDEAARLLSAAGAKRVLRLPVSGAFHSPLMLPAASELARVLQGVDVQDPMFPVIANATAAPVIDGGRARELLVEQLTSPVLWSASVGTMLDLGVRSFLEIGPGRTLCGLNRRIAPGVPCERAGEPGDIERIVTADRESRK